MKKRRILAVLLALVLVAGTLAACNRDEGAGTTASSPPSPSSSSSPSPSQGASPSAGSTETPYVPEEDLVGYTLPLSTTGETLRIATNIPGVPGMTYDEEMPIWAAIADYTGISVVWETIPNSEYNSIMSVRLAAGSDLPDICRLPEPWMQYAESGLAIPLNNLIDKYAFNMLDHFAKYPRVRGLMTAPDGEIYGINMRQSPDLPYGTNPVGIQVRQDWLADLGISEPTNLDEFTDMLRAFKTYDPFGDGSIKVIPFATHYPGMRVAVSFIGWAYGFHLFSDSIAGFYPNANGDIEYELTSPRFKELLTLFNNWWKEDLLDPNFMHFDNQQFTAIVANSEVGAYQNRVMNGANAYNTGLKESTGNPDAGFLPLLPLKGPYGDQFNENDHTPVTPGVLFAIMSTSQKQELALQFIDFVTYSPIGMELNAYGFEGVHWEWKDGERVITEEYANHPDGMMNAMRKDGMGFREEFPGMQLDNAIMQLKLRGEPLYTRVMTIVDMCPPFLQMPIATVDESEELGLYMSDLGTFVDEMIIAFITGTRPLDEFDSFVDSLYRQFNVQRVIEIKQQQYDRIRTDR